MSVAAAELFEEALYDAWRSAGFDAAPRPSKDGITFVCPACTSPGALDVADGSARCPWCNWRATGKPAVIVKAALALTKRPGAGIASGADKATGAKPFAQQLLGAWRAVGLDAAGRPDGGVTFGCPRCADLSSRLEVADGVAMCPACAWGAEGEPWAIAKAGAEARKTGGPGIEDADDAPETRPFPLHCLPPSVARMAEAISKTERTPAALTGCCVLGFLSGAIGAGLRVQSGPARWTRANLYILGSAESGTGKSESFRHAAEPFSEFEHEQIEEWQASTLPGIQAEKDVLEAEIKKLKGMAGKADGAQERAAIKFQLEQKKAALGLVERSAVAPVLSVEDITSERLAVLLAARGETLVSLSADAVAMVNNWLGNYSKLDKTDEGIYLKAFSGDRCRVDRQSREPITLRSPCLAGLWLVQPDKVDTLLSERSLTDGGLIPRFLICHTHAEALPITADVPAIPQAVRAEYRDTIRALLETYRLADEPRDVRPDPAALAALNGYFNRTVERRNGELRDVRPYVARYGEQAWRLALCIHAGTHGAEAHDHALGADTAAAAIELAEWFAGEQLAILGASRNKARRALFGEVLAILARKPDGIRASDIYRARIVPNAEAAEALLKKMEGHGELLCSDLPPPAHGGHITRIFKLPENN